MTPEITLACISNLLCELGQVSFHPQASVSPPTDEEVEANPQVLSRPTLSSAEQVHSGALEPDHVDSNPATAATS